VRLARRLALALWAGILVAVGGFATPTLFATLPERALAGLVAGELFRRVTLLSLVLAAGLALLPGARPAARLAALVPAALLAASEWGVRPELEAVRRGAGTLSPAFAAWHAVSAALYAAATLVTVALLWRELRATRD
jgi:hypothetical protein